MRRRGLVDRDREGNHVGPEGDRERAERRQKDDGDHPERRAVAPAAKARGQHARRKGSDRGKDQEIGPLEPPLHHAEILGKRNDKHGDQEDEQRDRQTRNEPVGELADLAVAFADEPARAEQRIADAKADAAEQREGAQPAEVAADIAAIGDRQPLDQSADGQPLHEGGDERTAGETRVPEPPPALRPMPELESDPAQDQPAEHEEQRQIEGGQKRRIDDRESAPEHHAGRHQPGLVAVPDGCDRADHRLAIGVASRSGEEDADAKVEAVEEHVEKGADGKNGRPEEDHGYSPAARWRASGRVE